LKHEEEMMTIFANNLEKEDDDPANFVSPRHELSKSRFLHYRFNLGDNIELLAGFGLPFLKRFSGTDLDGHLMIMNNIIRNRLYVTFRSLPFLDQCWNNSQAPGRSGEPINRENPGYRYADIFLSSSFGSMNLAFYRAGVVFWDEVRLETIFSSLLGDAVNMSTTTTEDLRLMMMSSASERFPPVTPRPTLERRLECGGRVRAEIVEQLRRKATVLSIRDFENYLECLE
jgi:hypothetical protein